MQITQNKQYQIDNTKLIKTEVTNKSIYIINLKPEGWMILSDKKNNVPILAHSSKGDFKAQSFAEIPNGPRQWLANTVYANVLLEKKADKEQQSDIIKEWDFYIDNTAQRIDPDRCFETGEHLVENVYDDAFLGTEWAQHAPYNLETQTYNYLGLSCGNGHTPTGCVATAMAQVMKFWNYPTTDANNVHYNWNIMQDSYSSSDTSTSAYEVAKLMNNCGEYISSWHTCDNGTGASFGNAESALQDDFYYTNANLIDYANSASQLRNNLTWGRPVILAGDTGSGWFANGHAWIADGYKDSYIEYQTVCEYQFGYITSTGSRNYRYEVRMNWGWGWEDSHDNWYADYRKFNPGNGNEPYIYDVEMIVNLYPLTN